MKLLTVVILWEMHLTFLCNPEDYLGKTSDSTPDTTDDKRYVYVNTSTNFSSVTIIRPSVYGEWDVDYSYKYEPFVDYLNEGRNFWWFFDGISMPKYW